MKKILSVVLALTLVLGLSSMAMADKLGMGVVATYYEPTNATADADGSAIANTVICAVTLNDTGVITAIHFDAVQTKVAFNATGVITTDTTVTVPTKVELGDAYGMKSASPMGKEYYEQLAGLEAFCVGKTVDQVIATPADDADLKSAATITLTDYFAALSKAAAAAK